PAPLLRPRAVRRHHAPEADDGSRRRALRRDDGRRRRLADRLAPPAARGRASRQRGVILYNSPISGNCYKVRLLAAHLGIPLELREVDVIDRSAPREELAGLNPTRNTPTLVLDDGRPLAESHAIVW